jgi:hypothetical protein
VIEYVKYAPPPPGLPTVAFPAKPVPMLHMCCRVFLFVCAQVWF